jgi:glycosyltransferase involved in cell wall biosynthesis
VTAGHRFRGSAKAIAAVGGTFLGRGLLRRRLRGLHSISHFVSAVMREHLLGGHRPDVIERIIPSFLPPVADEADAAAAAADAADQAFLARLPSEPYLLFVGSLLPQKGIWPLLAAYRRLRAPAPPLVLVGPSSYKSPTTFPPGVIAAGPASHAAVLAAWERAILGVVPSVGAEGFGNVVTEAMSRGRAVVASRLGGIVDIIVDGESGLLVPPSDDVALAAAIQRLLDDAELRERLGAAARTRVERFAAARVVPQFEQLYRDVLGA